MRKFAAALISLALLFMLSSCDGGSLFRTADSLLTPPLFYEEYEGLVEVFRSQAGDGASLCSPYEGDYRSAIIVEDFDGDKEKEAFIFYRDSDGDSSVKAMCYESSDGEWITAGIFNGHGNQIESVSVRDMNGDGISEVIVSWSVAGVTTGKTLSVYHSSARNTTYKEISNELCSVSMIVDVDGDSLDDIFLVTQNNNSTAPQRFARLISVSNGSAVLKGEVRVDANISSYVSVKTEKPSDEEPLRIFIDALKGEYQMITELIYWDKEKSVLSAPLFDEETMSTTLTLRDNPILSTDINGDGRIDVPSQTEVFATNSTEITIDPQYFYITSWLNFYNYGHEALMNTLVNYADGYMLTISSEDRFNLVVEDYRELNCWIIKEKNTETNEVTELYSILRISKEKFDEVDLSNYAPLIEKDEYTVFAYINPKGTEKGITDSELKSKIISLN